MVKIDREKTYTVEEYLTLEAQSELRQEFFYEKSADGDWVAKTYTEPEEIVKLPLLNATISLADIYNR